MPNQGRPSGPRGGDGRSSGRGDGRGDSRPSSGGASRSSAGRGGKPASGGRSGTSGDKPYSRTRRDDAKGGGRRDDRRDDRRGRPTDERSRTAEQAKYDGPPIDESITGKELDRSVAQQLRGLPEKLAARVARHLVAAGLLMETDPATAYQHTLAARGRAARIAVVREAVGEAAYAAGEYAEALSELRAAKRMNGSQDYLAVMADCERALGRPDRALALARNPAVANFEPELKAEMTIVEAGARRDLGELDAAIRTLENAPLRSRSREDWVVRLRYAYADTLLAAGRREDAIEWFHRTVGLDSEEITNAAERVAELEAGQTDPRPTLPTPED
jgi:tetratricopeptide (TPR) repeat protein